MLTRMIDIFPGAELLLTQRDSGFVQHALRYDCCCIFTLVDDGRL